MTHPMCKLLFDGAKQGAISTMMGAAFFLAACSFGDGPRVSLAPPPPAFAPSLEKPGLGVSIPLAQPASAKAHASMAAPNGHTNLTQDEPALPDGCSVLDRFDRSSTLSFSSEDGRRALALNLDTNGTHVNTALLQLRYQWGGKKEAAKPKAACLYPARVQGLLGSAYHEFVTRSRDTIWQQLRGLRAEFGR